MQSKEPTVAREVAEAEIARFLEAMDLEPPEDLGEEERSTHEKLVRTCVDAVVAGSLVVDEDGQPVYTPVAETGDQPPITFYEPDGATFVVMDKHKKDQNQKRFFESLGAMTKQPPVRFIRLKKRDLKVVNAIGVLFLS